MLDIKVPKYNYDIIGSYGNRFDEKGRQSVAGSQKSIVFDKQNGKCWKCKKKLKLSHTEYHHVKFVSKGGKSNTANLVALCANCHSDIHKREKAREMDSKKNPKNISRTREGFNILGSSSLSSNNLIFGNRSNNNIDPISGKKIKKEKRKKKNSEFGAFEMPNFRF